MRSDFIVLDDLPIVFRGWVRCVQGWISVYPWRHIIISTAGMDNLLSICNVMDASDGRGSSAELVVDCLHRYYPSSSSCRQLKQGADIGSAVCLIPWDTLLLGVWPHAARAVLVLSQGGEWISSLFPNVSSLATKPECVKKDPCPTPPWWAPWVVQSLTREAGGHGGSFPLKLIICIHVGTVCTCHCICLSLCDFGALGSLRFLIFLGYQFFQFLALKSCTIWKYCVSRFRKKKHGKVRLIVAWFITNTGNKIRRLLKIPLEIWACF